MSKEDVVGIIDQALLKGLDSNYQQGEEVLAEVWLEVGAHIQEGEYIRTYLNQSTPLPPETWFAILKRPWSEEPLHNGVRVKPIPYYFTEGLLLPIEKEWSTLPMFSKDMLIEKAEQDPRLKEIINRVLAKEQQE